MMNCLKVSTSLIHVKLSDQDTGQQSNVLNVINILWQHYNHTQAPQFHSIKTSFEQLMALSPSTGLSNIQSQRTQQGECLIEKLDEINVFFPPGASKYRPYIKVKRSYLTRV